MLKTILNVSSSALIRGSHHQISQQSSRKLFLKQIYLQQSSHLSNSEFIEDNLRLQVQTNEHETKVEAIPIPSGREGRLIQIGESSGACALCRLNLTNLRYTDVKILSQFVKKNGSVVTFHESKLCTKQYRRVMSLIKKAWRCNLMERPNDYLVPGPWHDLNTYLEYDRKRDFPMKVIKKQYWKI